MSKKPTQNLVHSNIEFKNLGKIKKANIQIRPFTVIAGCNSSGKSFITKSLYSLFSGIGSITNESLTAELISNLSDHSLRLTKSLALFANDKQTEDKLEPLITKLHQEITLLEAISPKEITSDTVLSSLDAISTYSRDILALVDYSKEEETSDRVNKAYISILFESATLSLNNLTDYLSNSGGKLNNIITANLAESLRDNFTIPSTSQLIHFNSKDVTITGEDFGLVKITDEVKAEKDTLSKIGVLNSHPPIYLESPIYWKLSDALEDSRKALDITAKRRNLDGNQLVSKVPKYFFDVVELLEDQVKTDEFNDIAQTIEDAIKGSLSLSDGGIQFVDKESNKAVSLSVTALGVTNLGMIALLLKRGAILPGTFLFIDEPEVHLHPMWQVVLVQVLHELSKRGVNVVIASHSIDIMKAIENIMNSDDEIDQQAHFGLNQLTEDGYSIDDTNNNFKRIAAIKEDLGKPFYDMFMGA